MNDSLIFHYIFSIRTTVVQIKLSSVVFKSPMYVLNELNVSR